MICKVCRHTIKSFIFRESVSPEQAHAWSLSSREVLSINKRESQRCPLCGCSLRSRAIAAAIVQSYPESQSDYLVDWVTWARGNALKIAEINYCAELHPYLGVVHGTKLSQYRESTLRARIANAIKGIKREDITNLSYDSNSFDLVLHSEVLEHVPDTKKALAECLRILKPGGICLFTVPLIKSRKTKKKVSVDHKSGELTFLEEPSYHGRRRENDLVFWEFGGDFINDNHLEIVFSQPQVLMWVLKMTKPN